MQISASPRVQLTYCLNVHPGETLADQLAAARQHAAAARDAVAPGKPFGLGLRISDAASREMTADARAVGETLAGWGFHVFTINGFPFGTFHGTAVKEQVYHPDWRADARRVYTCRLADALAELLPPGLTGSISTVPCSYRTWIRSAEDVNAMVVQLAATARWLDALRERTGREIHLGLEPEPDCFLQSTADVVAFFNDRLFKDGPRHLLQTRGIKGSAAEAMLRRHIGICFDTCHLALQYEDLCGSLRRLRAEGIRLSKLQISAALRTAIHAAGAAALRRFCDPVYLHQVKARTGDGAVRSRGDLEAALDAPLPAGEEWRIHFHVPLYFAGEGDLASTADLLTPDLFQTARQAGVEHFEIETYTFGVLPESLRALGIDRSIAEEYRWVLKRLDGF